MARRGLVECLSGISDPRMDRTKKHLLIDILVITVCAYVSGADNWIEVVEWAKSREDWLRKFLVLPAGIPSHDTFGRVFALIEPKEFEVAFQAWLGELRQALSPDGGRDFVSIDGKKLRSTFHYSGHCTSAIGIVSAWSSETGLVLGQRRYDYSGEHEKWVMRDVVDLLYLEGCVVTLDAAGATREIFEKVIEKKADFVIGLKKNFKGLYKIADEVFTNAYPKNEPRFTRSETEGKAHGRNEKRVYELIELKDAEFWRSRSRQEYLKPLIEIKSIGRVTSTREKNGETSQDRAH